MRYIKACKCYVCGNLFNVKKSGYTIAKKHTYILSEYRDQLPYEENIAICEECSKIMFNYINNVKRMQGEEHRGSEEI